MPLIIKVSQIFVNRRGRFEIFENSHHILKAARNIAPFQLFAGSVVNSSISLLELEFGHPASYLVIAQIRLVDIPCIRLGV